MVSSSGKGVYYQCLDSVRFANSEPNRLSNVVEAKASVLAGLLLGGVHPILSGPQAFDNAAILDELEEPNDESLALLQLVSDGEIDVRLAAPRESRPISLLAAFRTALERDFEFSAWAALADPDARAVAAAWIDHRAPVGETSLERRLEALEAFDSALSGGAVSRRAGPAAVGGTLDSWTRRAIRELADADGELRAAHALVEQAVPPRLRASRTTWRRTVAEILGATPGASRLLDCVDAAYNRVVADSLGADGEDVELAHPVPWMADGLIASGLADAAGARHVVIEAPNAFQGGEALTWMDAVDLKDGLRHMATIERRISHVLAHRPRSIRTDSVPAGRLTVVVAANAAGGALAAASGHFGGPAGVVVPGLVVGAATLAAGDPIRSWLTRGAGSWQRKWGKGG